MVKKQNLLEKTFYFFFKRFSPFLIIGLFMFIISLWVSYYLKFEIFGKLLVILDLLFLSIHLIFSSIFLVIKGTQLIKEFRDLKSGFLKLVFGYCAMVIGIVSLFSVIYIILGSFTNNGLEITNGTKYILGLKEFYFATLSFFSMNYGDIIPKGGLFKFIATLNVFIGQFVTVIGIGYLFSQNANSNKTKKK